MTSLARYMKDNGFRARWLNNLLKRKLGVEVTPTTISKWRQGKSAPDARIAFLIEDETDGEVTARSLLLPGGAGA